MLSDPATLEYWDARTKAHGGGAPRELYFKSEAWARYDRNVLAFIARFVRRGVRVLDLGCGFGLYGPHVEAARGSWTGVDFCAGMRDLWRTRGGMVGRFVQADVRDVAELLNLTWKHDVVMLGCIRRILGLSPEDMRDKYLPLVANGGVLANVEASECHVWDQDGAPVQWSIPGA